MGKFFKQASLALITFYKLASPNINFVKLLGAFKTQKIHKNTQGALLKVISENTNLSRWSHSQPERAVRGALKALNKKSPSKGLFISTPMGGKVR